jgi:hypothetical protein
MSGNITFTQYLLPYGRQRESYIERPDDVVAKARQIIAAGYVFESEKLRNGFISLTITDHKVGEDVAIELFDNDYEVPARVDKLIMGFEIPANRAGSFPKVPLPDPPPASPW